MSGTLRLRISGDNVRPETVPLTDLLKLLEDLQAALLAGPKPKAADTPALSLVNVSSGSCALELAVDSSTERRARKIESAIRADDPKGLPAESVRRLHSISKRASRCNWEISLSRNGGEAAVINPGRTLFDVPVVKEHTSIVAYIIRAGGDKNPTAGVRLSSGQELTVGVDNKETVLTLGTLLFQWVDLNGEAEWESRTSELRNFKVHAIGPYRSGSADPIRGLRELHEASEGLWDSIDPTEYLRELRGGE